MAGTREGGHYKMSWSDVLADVAERLSQTQNNLFTYNFGGQNSQAKVLAELKSF